MAVVVDVLKVVVGIAAFLAAFYLVARFWSMLFGDARAALMGGDGSKRSGDCPCGCGRSLGWQKRRTALHAMDVQVGLPILERLAASLPRDDPDRSEFVGSHRYGAGMARVMLKMAHGEQVLTAAIPSPRDLARWREGTNVAAAVLAAEDPEWIADYRTSLPTDDRKLVDSMVTTGTLTLQQRR
tara:strand:- start:350 stop:901 length:552 start_codon:yes stop_codon:yes gene_type:complete